MPNKTQSYKDKVIEEEAQSLIKCLDVMPKSIKELQSMALGIALDLSKFALEEQMKLVISCLPANIEGDVKRFDGFLTCLQQTRENLKSKGLI